MSLILSGTNGLSDVDGSAATPAIRGTDTNTGIFFPAADTLAFSTNGTEDARFDSAGNFGIGTTSPANYANYKTLTVQAPSGGTGAEIDLKNSSGTTVGAIYSTATDFVIASDFTNAIANSILRFDVDGAERMRIDASGNLGVGTTSPNSGARLTLSSGTTDAQSLSIDSTNTSGGRNGSVIFRGTYGAGGGGLFDAAIIARINLDDANNSANSQALAFYTKSGTSAPAERARIDSSGNFMLGQTAASYQNANSIWTSTPNGQMIFSHASGTSSGIGYAIFAYNGSGIGSITQNGTTAVAYNTSSDYRLKHDIAPMTGALAKVAALKPCTYKWNADNSDGEGFIAHELAEVCPHAVTGEKDATRIEQYEISPAVPATFDEEGNELTPAVESVIGEREVPVYQGIDTSFLVATLTAAIQEQQAIITQLQADVAALKARA